MFGLFIFFNFFPISSIKSTNQSLKSNRDFASKHYRYRTLR